MCQDSRVDEALPADLPRDGSLPHFRCLSVIEVSCKLDKDRAASCRRRTACPVPPRRNFCLTRRTMLRSAGAFGGTLLAGGADGLLGSHRAKAQSSAAPAVVTSDSQRPQIPYGVMSGDPSGGRAILWSKTDRPARMLVEFATRDDFRDARRIVGPAALPTPTTPPGSISAACRPAPRSSTASTFQDLADPKR